MNAKKAIGLLRKWRTDTTDAQDQKETFESLSHLIDGGLEMNDMIERARELSKLADKATPGPWAAHVIPNSTDMWVAGALSPEGYADICDVKTSLTRGPVETATNAKLIAAAPEMAKLLNEMANGLEKARKLCREFSMAYCDVKEELDYLKQLGQKK